MNYWEPLQWTGSFAAESAPRGLMESERFVGAAVNNLYTVWVYELPGDGEDNWHHLSIKRFDKAACRDWRHFQRIKTEICGAEREAIELFPAESRLLDAVNQYHLWVMPQDMTIPVGISTRAVADAEEMLRLDPKAEQRKFDHHLDAYLHHEGLLSRLPDRRPA